MVIIVEVLLQSINYGNDYSTFVKISDQFENYKFFNPKLPQKYFGKLSVTPSVIADGFKKIKENNTFRIFALGGSTTAGFPHPPNGSFPRLLKKLLQKEYPNIGFEVVNLGVSAINTITIRDIINDVLNEEPDLIIFYAGHNEYYGALGPSSNVAGFYNLFFTRLLLELKEFRIVQLLENLIADVVSIVSEKPDGKKTLMSEMAGKNLVPLNSEEFEYGFQQFESNLDYILSRCTDENVPILVGTLASNLLQDPLCKYAGCESLVNEFTTIKMSQNSNRKEKLYEIKDRDELRFRAPEKLNEIILSYSKKYSSKVFDVKKMFEKHSPDRIIGDNLMLDHLHPTYGGNMIVAELLLDLIKNNEIISPEKKSNNRFPQFNIDSQKYLTYSSIDSLFANLRVEHLKRDFPFSNEKIISSSSFPNPISIEDSLAQKIIAGDLSWENAHLNLAAIYYKRGEYNKYINEINVLIEDKPFDKFPYIEAIRALESINKVELSKSLLHKYFKIYPELFAARKLGDIYFAQLKHREALYFYEKCEQISKNDSQLYFNLSACYFAQKNLKNAYQSIQKCLKINPKYPNAQKIFNGIRNIYQTRK